MVRIGFITCVLLVVLRLAIGWHFFFEGLNKYESVQRGESERGKPFSSAVYFGGVEGPLSSKAREFLGTPDTETLAKLKLAESNDDKPAAKMPTALAQEWDAYLKQFSDDYKLDNAALHPRLAARSAAEAILEKAKTDYVGWLTQPRRDLDDAFRNDEKVKKIKVIFESVGNTITYEVPDHPLQRVTEYEGKLLAIRDAIHRESEAFGKDVQKARLTALRGAAVALRVSLQKDIDEFTKKYKDSLAKLVKERLVDFSYDPPEKMLVDDRILDLLTLRDGPNDPNANADQLISRMPVALDEQWNNYLAFERATGKDALRNNPQQADQILADEKLRFVRYLLDFDEYVGGRALPEKTTAERLEKYRAAVAELRKAQDTYRNDPNIITLIALARAMEAPKLQRPFFIAEVSRRTDILKKNLGGFKEQAYKGIVEIEKPKTRFLWLEWPSTRQEWMDWSTRWGLLIAGGCVLIGLFTRLACLGCVFFLVMEYLLNSPFPYLPVSPKSEGSYLFVNKNVIELLALLVLATLPTGRWLGVDAILCCIWPFRRRTKPSAA